MRTLSAALCVAAALATSVPAGVSAGEKYAFLVGVSDYDRKDLKPLLFTRNDILDLQQILVDSGYDRGNIVLMHDDLKQLSNRRYFPEAEKIQAELKLLLSGLEADDSIVVALSGHGVQFRGEKRTYFCPADARLDDRRTLIEIAGLYSALKDCRAKKRLLLIDACRDDPQSSLAKSRQTVELESVTRPQIEAVPEGIIALFSCGEGQRSFEDPELKHGIFFHHVLLGLKGDADNGDRELTLDELVSFAKTKTQTFARTSFAAVQTPQQVGDFTGTWVLRSLKSPSPFGIGSRPTRPGFPGRPPVRPVTTKPSDPPAPSEPATGRLPASFAGSKPGDEWTATSIGMKFCWCPDGDAEKRTVPSRPGPTVVSKTPIHGFWIGKYEVTQREWKAVMRTTAAEQRAKTNADDPLKGESADHPMCYVSHDEALEFCRGLTIRERRLGRLPKEAEFHLPSELQWEYAALAGTPFPASGPSADGKPVYEDYAWIMDNAGETTHPVGQKQANAWGLHDVHGNVAEWSADEYLIRTGFQAPSDKPLRVIKGSHFLNPDLVARIGIMLRPKGEHDERKQTVGFRVVVRPAGGDPAQKPVPVVGEPPAAVAGKRPAPVAGAKPGDIWDVNGLRMTFCWCPEGKAPRLSAPWRSAGEKEASLDGFWMGRFEVTQSQWKALMGTTVAQQRDKDGPRGALRGEGPENPIYFVSHEEAVEFCRRMTEAERAAGRLPEGMQYRLPSEAEWEYAALAGTEEPRPTRGAGTSVYGDYAWYHSNARGTTWPVGQKTANAWGLHDVHGNVTEWCQDEWGRATTNASEDSILWLAKGSHCLSFDPFCRVDYRYKAESGDRLHYIGFRVALAREPVEEGP